MRWPPDADWPMVEHSRQVVHRPHRWHIQETGTGPTLLLLHGAGGATQSFRGLFPLLAQDHHVIALDLPGQGYSQSGARPRLGLQTMAQDIQSLMIAEGWNIDAVVGHSAGAALALQLADNGALPDAAIVSLNGALSTFRGVAGWIFPAMAKVLSITPFTADLFVAAASSPGNVARLIAGTGSTLTKAETTYYQRLISDRSHVDGTLAMMAQWRLEPLLDRLPQITIPTLLAASTGDRTVSHETSRRAAELLPRGRLKTISDLGHLMHEEDPELIANIIRDFLREQP